MEDQPADSGDLTTGEPDKPRRRLLFGRRRRAEAVVEESVETPAESEAAAPERRTPTGKAGRKVAAEPEGDVEPEGEVEPAGDVEPEGDVEPAAETEGEAEPEADAEAAEAEQADDVVLVPHREAGKRLTYCAVGAAAVFVVAGAFGGAMLQPYLADRALVATKLQVAQTSADAITTLWTYNPDNIETLPDRAAKYLSSDFANQYRQLIDSIVPTNKQAQVTNNTEVMGTAVETIGPDEATAIVYTNTVSTSPVTKNVPSLRYMSYRLILQRTDGDWLITQMPALTQLDLSPQL
ncbi:mammalian cell entry protein [Mycolicibacterium neworleansense]|uniref:Mce associated membrane protein n=1 Tax=Mycolicibacterium neworleansense TaxID=146018 RepID=A0A0H5RSE1_9MYCO|nr:mammalian cell entry protein [Mycolicibacterium neworleansense]MCV7363189.1 mammalian cell entry protein [Mycolicibacterium neworleansense]CRZ17085.1 mce associated membrane protein [Mycolicibacterium neworleansense]